MTNTKIQISNKLQIPTNKQKYYSFNFFEILALKFGF